MKASGLLLYGAGQLGVMLLARFFFQWVIRFADVGRDTATGPLLAAGVVGMVFFGFRIFDGVTDPLAGALGDYWVRTGRQRRSLIWPSFLLPALGLALVFSPDASMSPLLRWALLGAGMFLFFVGYTLYAIPYWSLVEDYSEGNEKVRTSLSNSLGVGVLVATGLGFVVSPIVIEKLGFLSGAVVFGVLGAVLMVLPYFAAPKGVQSPPTEHTPPLRRVLGSALGDRKFRATIILFAGAQMSFTVMTSAAPYIAEKLLLGTIGDVAKLLGPFLLAAVPAFIFVPRLSARFGWEKTTVIATITIGIAYAGAGLLGKGIVGSPMTTAMLVFAAAGPGAAVVLGLEGEAIARSAEVSEFRSTSMYFGVYNFIVKALNGLALYFTGMLAQDGTVAAVRAMPMIAGGLCVAGVVLYLAMKRQGTAPLPPVAAEVEATPKR